MVLLQVSNQCLPIVSTEVKTKKEGRNEERKGGREGRKEGGKKGRKELTAI